MNYDDERFKQVENQEQQALQSVNNMYNNMINQNDRFYQDQIQAAENYGKQQAEIQQANTDFAIEKINQQKDQAQKDYTKEQKGAYADWQRQSNQYGVNAEQMATSGLTNTGYSESSQVSMYNTYQNRVSQARDTFNRAVLEYDNGIKEAQLTNNAQLAEIAYNSLATKLQLSLDGFQAKNQLLQQQMAAQNDISDRYYSRWQDVLKQLNEERNFAEEQRQFNEKMKEEQRQFNTQIALSKRSSGGSGGGSKGKNTINKDTKMSKYAENLYAMLKKGQTVGNMGINNILVSGKNIASNGIAEVLNNQYQGNKISPEELQIIAARLGM